MNESPETSPEPNPDARAARSAGARKHRAAIGRLLRLCLKEWRETLRDRRTILTLILMPLLVYPLLSIMFQRFLVTSLETSPRQDYVIALNTREALPLVERYLNFGYELLKSRQPSPVASAGSPGGMSVMDEEQQAPRVSWHFLADLERALQDGQIDLAIRVSPVPQDEGADEPQAACQCELLYRENSPYSKAALDFVSDCFRVVNEAEIREQVRAMGARIVLPAEVHRRAIPSTGAAVSLTTLVPLILILMTITGAVYPAIDLTAGERERGTLETLMAAPVPRLALLAAKYVAVLTVALLTAGANLVAMTVTLTSSGLSSLIFGESGLSLWIMAEVLFLLVLFAAFFSAVLLALTSFARSFKEAQAYLIPVMLLSLAPGMLSLMPGLQFHFWLALTPLVNIVLLARDVFEGTINPATALLAVSSTLLYAVAAIAAAARIFGTDALLYGSEGGWSDLISRPAERRDAASLTTAMFCMAVLVPCLVLLAGSVRQQPQLTMDRLLILNALVSLVLLVGVPLLAAILQRVRLARGFRLQPASGWAFGAAVILGLASWPIAYEIFLVNKWLGLTTLSEGLVERVAKLLDQWGELSPWLILFSVALAPAVCEELLFRGYLFSAVQRATSAGRAIWVSALLFGIYHVVAGSLAMPERFLPTTFVGLILGWIAWRSGSVLPGILMHFCHNGLLLMVAYYREELIERGWGVQQQQHLPASWLAASMVGLAVGGGLLYLAGRPRRTTMPDA